MMRRMRWDESDGEADEEADEEAEEAADEPLDQAGSHKGDKGDKATHLKRKRSYLLDTLGAAFETLLEQAHAQVRKGAEDGSDLNTATRGDAALRVRIQTLLPLHLQRRLFYELVGAGEEALGRLRSLFGAPPYAFLRSEDCASLRAAGVAASRVNIGYASGEHVLNYTQFGEPHLLDAVGRQYRLMQEDAPSTAPTAILALDAAAANSVTLTVRIARRTREQRVEAFATAEGRHGLEIPRAGEILTLTPTRSILRTLGQDERVREATHLRVLRVRSGTADGGHRLASTALLVAERM